MAYRGMTDERRAMRFTFRQLEYFVAAGETGSITLAAERINISQPSISSAISQLEAELGVQLFVRHHAQGLSLTPAGKRLLREAKELLSQALNLYDSVSDVTAEIRGTLSVGCMVTMAPMIMPELCYSFCASFPRTSISQTVASQEALIEGLRRAEIDLALLYDLDIPKDIEFEPLVSLPPYVQLSETHPLANHSRLGLSDLVGEPLILLDLPLSREYFLQLFASQSLTPCIGARTPYPDMLRTMVANGHGYGLANVRPKADLALDGRRLVRVPLAGSLRPMRICVATLGNLRPSRLAQAFENHCKTFISDGYIPGMVPPRMDTRA
ncbi:DNA-binding transcriptional regulator, LysR family [Insolitispirillum peregrinum]|uniref:DNA-binding transcriptional regulator, LysR family n=2 Tax=Insolitispirillum peregrinum TaxID=80876 RepID=A0A1N7Q1I9_9PROT|nr:DNA-binding transcriptional regulator, LysR family [Insolitispirillum peregrinum]